MTANCKCLFSMLLPISLRLPAILCTLLPMSLVAQANDPKPKDYSNSTSVTISLGDGPGGRAMGDEGLRHFARAGGADARTTFMSMEGMPCRCLDPSAERFAKGYFPFAIDADFKGERTSRVRIDVEYFDGFEGHLGVMGLQYDATGVGKGQEPKHQACYPNVPLKGSQKWLKAAFHLKGATFQNSQGAGGDFRLWASPPELCVKRVTVTLEPEQQAPKEKPLAFNADGEGKLGEWNVQWDMGAKPSFASNLDPAKGQRWLEVRAPGVYGAGSWRTTALLEPGDYQFVGKAKTDGLKNEEGGQTGVSLRISFHWDGKFVSSAPDWTPLGYDFTMPEQAYVELIAEVHGSQGSARFDPDSLKLIRKK